MTEFWSTWIVVLVVINLGITVFLFLWGLRVDIPTQPDGTSGHVWAHGVLREGVRRLPTWWVVLSAGSLIAGIVYLAPIPGPVLRGQVRLTSASELAQDQQANRRLEAPLPGARSRQAGRDVAADLGASRRSCCSSRLRQEVMAATRGNQAWRAGPHRPRLLYGGDGKSILRAS
jgi:cytochrome c oxidase cbb3-type subunit 3